MISKRIEIKPQKYEVEFGLTEGQYALVMPVGDVHFGTEHFPTDHFVHHLKWGMERGAWFLGMGEYLDFTSYSQRAIALPLRDMVKQQIDNSIQALTDEFCDLIEFTKGRWLGLIEGDHRWTFLDATSVDQRVCKRLGADFLGTSACIRLVPDGGYRGHPEADCIIYAHHGIGSSIRIGGHLHRVEDMLRVIEADIYLMGHTHHKVGAPIDRLVILPDGTLSHRTIMFARTGAFMRTYTASEPLPLDAPAYQSRGTYIEERTYAPSALGGLCIGIGVKQVEDTRFYRPAIHFSI